MIIRWIIQAIGIGQQGAEERTEFEPLMPVLIGTCSSAELQPQDQPDVVSADLRQQTLETQTRGHALATLALILINDDDSLTRPPQAMARSTKAYCRAVDST